VVNLRGALTGTGTDEEGDRGGLDKKKAPKREIG